MDYEKLYKEALERAREIHGKERVTGMELVTCEEIFPQLKESEDERIRKEIIAYLDVQDAISNRKDGDFKDWIAWLEQRGEQKSVEWDYPYGENETVDKLMAIAECLEMDEDFMYNGYTGTECVKFLRDLARKQVECKPEEWSEEDEEMFEALHACVCRCINDDRFDYAEREQNSRSLIPFIERLKSLRSQPKQEWSEEDEKMKSLIISTLTSMGTLNLERYYHMNLDEVKNWLKSLKPRWKPTDEMISMLTRVCSNLHLRDSNDAEEFDNFLEQLKNFE